MRQGFCLGIITLFGLLTACGSSSTSQPGPNGLTVTITTPAPADTLSGNQTLVTGTYAGDPTSGVTVNGVIANTEGNTFVVNNLPLKEGENLLLAKVTTPGGDTATHEIKITRAGNSPFQLEANNDSGIAPLPVEFGISAQQGVSLQRIQVDYESDGVIDVDATDIAAVLTHTYTNPGRYRASFTATDANGISTSRTMIITIYDAARMDQRFGAIWSGLSKALGDKDTVAATRYFTTDAQAKYRPVFDALKEDMPAIAASFSPLARVSITGNHGEYAIVRNLDGQNHVYFVHFTRDKEGVWRLQEM